jgi:hypothetical protein
MGALFFNELPQDFVQYWFEAVNHFTIQTTVNSESFDQHPGQMGNRKFTI